MSKKNTSWGILIPCILIVAAFSGVVYFVSTSLVVDTDVDPVIEGPYEPGWTITLTELDVDPALVLYATYDLSYSAYCVANSSSYAIVKLDIDGLFTYNDYVTEITNLRYQTVGDQLDLIIETDSYSFFVSYTVSISNPEGTSLAISSVSRDGMYSETLSFSNDANSASLLADCRFYIFFD